MLDKFIYENHLGQRFTGLDNGVYLNYSELRDYSWNYDTINSRISRFYRPITSRKIPLVIKCDSDEEAVAVKNRLFELAETDIESKLPGKIYIGEYYTNGYITASKKSDYLINKRLCCIELTLTSDDPSWYREQTYIFPVGGVEREPDESESDTSGTGGITPEGTLYITENGVYDITNYAEVYVNVVSGTSASDDGNGNVTLTGVVAASDDGNGNVTLTGVVATSNGGNVTMT